MRPAIRNRSATTCPTPPSPPASRRRLPPTSLCPGCAHACCSSKCPERGGTSRTFTRRRSGHAPGRAPRRTTVCPSLRFAHPPQASIIYSFKKPETANAGGDHNPPTAPKAETHNRRTKTTRNHWSGKLTTQPQHNSQERRGPQEHTVHAEQRGNKKENTPKRGCTTEQKSEEPVKDTATSRTHSYHTTQGAQCANHKITLQTAHRNSPHCYPTS